MKVRERSVATTVKLQACKEQNLLTIQTRIRKMAKQKIIIAKRPIMSATLESEIEAALAQFDKVTVWRSWGLHLLREQGNMVLLEGPPGTGKTTIARYMSKRVGRGLITLNMKDVGGKAPGHTDRMIEEKFAQGRREGGKTIFMDEVEAIIWDRGRAGSDSMWMVTIIDELLMQCASYPWLIVAATNMPGVVDVALKDRCFAVLQVGMPEAPERKRLWQQKIPEAFPVHPTTLQFEKLAQFTLSGRQIENAIVREASMAITQDRLPTMTGLIEACQTLTNK